ncbi:MAG: GSCFA domain-containing protein [Agriterribacter sp.]
MDFRTALDIKPFPQRITHQQKILLSGSCFTEHISNYLLDNKFAVLSNPNGILFNPISIASSITSYIEQKTYTKEELFYYNDTWNSWDHHSRFSDTDAETAVKKINDAQLQAHEFIKTADWVIITLGSAFVYEWLDKSSPIYPVRNTANDIVANCHKVPADKFRKRLLTVEEVLTALDNLMHRIFIFNPAAKIIFTISPVRHLRDGLIENNKSKAVLIQAVHHIVEKFEKLFYFPAYELVIDDLRDYRFYAEDMVHPNYMATDYVWEKFTAACIDPSSHALMKEMSKINAAIKHRAFNPSSAGHQQFLKNNFTKVQELQVQHPHIDFSKELRYFNT